MTIFKTDLHCPTCGKSFPLEMVENMSEDELIEECPLCGSHIDIQLHLDPQGTLVGAEIHRMDGDRDD